MARIGQRVVAREAVVAAIGQGVSCCSLTSTRITAIQRSGSRYCHCFVANKPAQRTEVDGNAGGAIVVTTNRACAGDGEHLLFNNCRVCRIGKGVVRGLAATCAV